MKVGVCFLKSPLNVLKSSFDVKKESEEIGKVLSEKFGPLTVIQAPKIVVYEKDASKLDVDVYALVILSGGTEALMKEYHKFSKPVFLFTVRINNSLAAAMEAREWIMRKVPTFLVHEKKIKNNTLLKNFEKFESWRAKLQNSIILTIGGSSNWLVSSFVTKERLKDFGIDLVVSDSEEYVKSIQGNKGSLQDGTKSETDGLLKTTKLEGITKDDVIKTMKNIDQLQKMVKDKKIIGLTIRCIDVIEDLGTSLCLPVSLLNDKGIVVSCEGDLRSLFAMIVNNLVFNFPCFMGNFNDFDVEKKEILITHCTIATKLCNEFSLKTHFETQKGVAIHGRIKPRKVILFNIDVELKNAVVASGRIKQTLGECEYCRTQLCIEMENMKYIDMLFGNHQVVCFQENKEDLIGFLKFIGIKVFDL